jgi:dephospho-CoA kinase
MNKIICIVGMPGSGKSVVADELVSQGFFYLRFGQITLDKIKEQGLAVSEANERKTREGFRDRYGMGAFAILNIPKIDEALQKSNVVVDGLYSWTEYKILEDRYRDLMYVLAIFAPPETRYKRLETRIGEKDSKNRFRPLTREEAKARDYSEIENIEKGGPIVMADFTIINTGTKSNLKTKVKEILSLINKRP